MIGSYETFAKEQIPLVEDAMIQFIEEVGTSELLLESMTYSVTAGGKKFRALLLLATLDFFDVSFDKSHYGVAAALEMIHTYSLIHDDLPAMDDDDLRRGKPTNHKVFGEGMAILAGDGLLTEAFGLIASLRIDSSMRTELIRALAKASGSQGMIAGQVMDISSENKKISLKELQEMHAKKTGALIRFAVEGGLILSGATHGARKWLLAYAENVGIAFQVRDDLLDVVGDEASLGKRIGADVEHQKNTYVSLLGLSGARKAFENHCALADSSLEKAKKELNKTEATMLEAILEELQVI